MDVIVERPAALDVHKAQVTACVRVPGEGGQRVARVEQFKTTVRGLLVLHDWLKAHWATQVTMEATGVYWKPGFHVLEDDFELAHPDAPRGRARRPAALGARAAGRPGRHRRDCAALPRRRQRPPPAPAACSPT